MAIRWGLGPVFAFECRLGARRWQVYASRVVLLLAVLVGLAAIGAATTPSFHNRTQVAMFSIVVFTVVVTIQMGAALLVAPAVAAGALCIDRGRGTLLHVLVTDLSAWEIVAGKLAARLAPVLALVLVTFPVLALCSLLRGLDVQAVTGAYLATAGAAAVGAALALTFSVWVRRIHQALIPAYLVLGLWVGLYPALVILLDWPVLAGWGVVERLLLLTNPFGMALGPYLPVAPAGLMEQSAFLAVCLVLAWLLTGFAASRLRSATVGQSSRPARRTQTGLPARLVELVPGPSLDANPVLWREWHRKRPSRWTGRFWSAYALLSGLASAALLAVFFLYPGAGFEALAGQVNAWGVGLGLLLLGVSAATALAEERDRGSLDVVLATPLATREIVWAKWWGTFAMVPRLLVFPVWVACGLALVTGQAAGLGWMVGLILAYASAITSLGLGIATWIPRASRAVGNTVLAYAMLTVGSYVALEAGLLLLPGRSLSAASKTKLLLGNPFHGVLTTTEFAGSLGQGYLPWHPGDRSYDFLAQEPAWPLFWIAGYAAAAAVLLLATRVSFDRCLGRVAERPRARPMPGPPVRSGNSEPTPPGPRPRRC